MGDNCGANKHQAKKNQQGHSTTQGLSAESILARKHGDASNDLNMFYIMYITDISIIVTYLFCFSDLDLAKIFIPRASRSTVARKSEATKLFASLPQTRITHEFGVEDPNFSR